MFTTLKTTFLPFIPTFLPFIPTFLPFIPTFLPQNFLICYHKKNGSI